MFQRQLLSYLTSKRRKVEQAEQAWRTRERAVYLICTTGLLLDNDITSNTSTSSHTYDSKRLGWRIQRSERFCKEWMEKEEEALIWERKNNVAKKGERKVTTENKKHTTPGIRWSSPTQLLVWPSLAYLWESGRDPEFSSGYGRMC